jgi:DnaJ like chaperone protein
MYIFNYKYYKWFALIPGWMLGGFIGAIASFLLVRELMSNRENEVGYELALLKLSSLLIMSDGKIDREEIELVQKFFKNTFGNSKSKKLFNDLKDNTNIPSDIDSLTDIIKKKLNPSKQYSIIQFLFSLSAVDGVISESEEDFIFNVGNSLGYTNDRLNNIKNQFVKNKRKTQSKRYSQKIIDSLNVLGLKDGASSSEIKKAYRSLAKEFHPDKLSGMSDGIINLAKEKFQLIQDSYEYLNKHYV